MYSIRDITEYIVVFIAAFAKQFNMTDAQAYRFLRQHDAIKVTHDYYDVMHTQPLNDMVQGMASYCRRKGGTL